MARLPTDSFLPTSASGPIDSALNMNNNRLSFGPGPGPIMSNGSSGSRFIPHSTTSPAGLAHLASQAGYFDTRPTNPNPSSGQQHHHAYSPLSSASAARHLPQPQSFLSPPDSQSNDVPYGRRPSSLSPPACREREIPSRKTFSAVTSPVNHPSYPGNGYSPSLSTAVPSQPRNGAVDSATTAQIIRRLSQQNSRLREAWEAERKYMEANRERVEEVYKEERVIMEEERTEWEEEKAAMLEEIRQLRQRVSGLEGDNIQLQTAYQRLELEKAGKVARVSVSIPGPRSSGDGSTDIALTSPRHLPVIAGGDLRGTSKTAITDMHSQPRVFSPGGSRISPSMHPETLHLSHFAQNMHPLSPPIDFLASPQGEDVPIVDIQTIHPELEGVPLRAPAVQRETFTDSGTDDSRSSSRNLSPTEEDGTALRRHSSKEQTLQVLSAPEPKRLVMHAGHTPNHSLSQFPTAAGTEAATVAGESGSQTPTGLGLDIPPVGDHRDLNGKPVSRLEDSVAFELEASFEDFPEPEPMHDVPDDRPLKGPLMVRNIPAHDEIFFRRLSEKLEDVSRGGEEATPTCMQSADLDGPVKGAKENAQAELPANDGPAEKGPDAHDDSDRQSRKDDQVEIPLKLKKTTNNFGAPLGTMF
ncbi:hypothetical protein F5X68DRAFT_189669 [Plectosphaerella plurivora]|uniref:Uncharacterized protein n=1 Tax=Plectosphaerella plurivora TaxID=936078 RepID=A0A9P9AC15_9PEZI|nr:hypothetical protein F5X68DRAFT_189669 [Plectosphaerella plurivora]